MIRIVGDISFADAYFDIGFGIGHMVKKGEDPLAHFFENSKDKWFGNLECVVSDVTEKKGPRSTCFRVEEETFKKLSHFNIYSVANNHIMEHGQEAFDRTLAAVSETSDYVGSNNKRSILLQEDDINYAIMSFSLRKDPVTKKPGYWYRPEMFEILEEYQKIKSADFKIVYLHWGNEFINYPTFDQKVYAHWLIDIGFDLVTGSHSHVLQGYEIYKGKYIFYSLGNFLFNMSTPETRYSAIVNIKYVEKKFDVTYTYTNIDKNCNPKILDTKELNSSFSFKEINKNILNNDDNEIYYSKAFKNLAKYRKENHKVIMKNLIKFDLKTLKAILLNYFKRKLTWFHQK